MKQRVLQLFTIDIVIPVQPEKRGFEIQSFNHGSASNSYFQTASRDPSSKKLHPLNKKRSDNRFNN